MPETTFTVTIATIGFFVGIGIGWGLQRAKLLEVERLIKALFTKVDVILETQRAHQETLARHDERIQAIRSDVRELRGIPSSLIDAPSSPMSLPR